MPEEYLPTERGPLYYIAEACGDERMDEDWEEGFTCTLIKNHDGPHRDNDIGPVKDINGRLVQDAYEWEYLNEDEFKRGYDGPPPYP